MPDPRRLELHPDRLLPADPSARSVARRIYAATRRRPIVSPHGHVEAALLAEDRPFADPASLLVTPDHYVTRLLHASGAPLAALGVGAVALTEDDARRAWRILCERWSVFAGTPVRYWLEEELAGIFGVDWRPAPATADAIYDRVAARLADDDFRPRALYRRFGMEVLSTTPDPGSDLAAERALAADATWQGRVVPAFRPDVYLEPGRPPWKAAVAHLGEVTGIDTWDYRGYIDALEARRRYFADHGCVSTDHGHLDAGTQPLDAAEASRLFRAATSGGVSEAEAAAFRRHMVFEMARMSCEDGLVMALHVGLRRDHHGPTTTRFGRDTGSDIPLRIDFTDPLRPLLEAFGTHPRFRLVVFTVDETAWSRELAPLAGFYPSVYVGVPWWFLDAPDAIGRFRAAVTETAGFSRTSGFVDDARSLCSIPARHDMARRIDAGFLARLVVEHRMDEEEAVGVAVDLAGPQARRVFNL